MTPLMPANHADFAAVRQHAAVLRDDLRDGGC
jgi:hypothetical protein